MKKLIAGIFVGALLLYLTLRGIDYPLLLAALKRIDYTYVWATVVILVIMQLVRSVRWGLLLAPMESIRQTTLFAITSVGFLAIALIPARLGELARPYLIAQKSSIPMSSAIATVVCERFLDAIVVLTILTVTLALTPLPSWITISGRIVIGGALVIGIAIVCLGIKRDAVTNHVISLIDRLPHKWRQKTQHMVHHFLAGFRIVTDGRRLLLAGLLSVVFWFLDISTIYLLLLAFHIALPPVAPVIIMLVLLVGIMIPTAPGFIGNWHFACVVGLAIFQIPKAEALSFAIVYHFVSLAVLVFLGIIFLPAYTVRFRDLTATVSTGIDQAND